jgi:nardilysin
MSFTFAPMYFFLDSCLFYNFQAGIAGLGSSLCNFDDKMQIRIWGYNDKLSVLLSKILLTFSSFSPAIDRFKV